MNRPSEISTIKDLELETFWRAQKSHLVRDMLNTACSFALSDLGIRIVGEKGSGKLHLARLIHQYSSRGQFSFTHKDCSELGPDDPEILLFGGESQNGSAIQSRSGLLESAEEGTIYLDMLSSLPPVTQMKLLRVFEMRRFRRKAGNQDIHLNVRIITGQTHRHTLESADWVGDFELPTRISPVCINIPPLRERREDIESLIYLFLNEISREFKTNVKQITSDALDICRYYSWPGNIYELRNVIRHSALVCNLETIQPFHLPEYVRQEHGPGETVRMTEIPMR